MYKNTKNDYSMGPDINIVWEGYPHNLKSFVEIGDTISKLRRSYKVNMHLITSVKYNKYMNRMGKKYTVDEVEKATDFARNSPFPEPEDLFDDMWANPIPLP